MSMQRVNSGRPKMASGHQARDLVFFREAEPMGRRAL